MTTNQILLELMKRLQADSSIRVDIEDLIIRLEKKLSDEKDWKPIL